LADKALARVAGQGRPLRNGTGRDTGLQRSKGGYAHRPLPLPGRVTRVHTIWLAPAGSQKRDPNNEPLPWGGVGGGEITL